MSGPKRVEIPGSERTLHPDHVRVGDVDLTGNVAVSVYLAHRVAPEWVDEEARRQPHSRKRISREQWAQAHGALPDHVNAVCRFAEDHGLVVGRTDEGRRQVKIMGSVGAVADAFGANFEGMYAPSEDGPAYRARSGPLSVPEDLGPFVTGVFGLDDRPVARPQIRFAQAGAVAYTPPEVARAYGFPSDADGSGEAVGIIELGGGYQESDLTTYFESLQIAPPTVTAIPVDGGSNNPGADTDADGEVMLDIEMIGSLAPAAQIVVYFSPNTDQGFIDAVSEAVHDSAHKISVVSISWGGSEDSWTTQARTQMETILTDAGGLGVTVTVAAGDNGSSDGSTDGSSHVDFPASAPHALACGGTTLEISGTAINSETVWDTPSDGATGGGVSDVFALPSYQSSAHVPGNADTGKPGRGVPDVAADANPQTGYTIRVDGSDETIGGTSAVAPLWAGLIALLNQAVGAPLGFAQPRLYALLGSTAFHDITSGSNGAYSAGPGWDACTGLGSPSGANLARQLGAS
ncbi:MAG TPA: S53 family peptidase [Solirubrobacteraceae bacterium]|nr:S53 family peptidase [Solirubrobacteraceae bacterium]